MRYSKLMFAATLGALFVQSALATPTPEEAAQLGKTLTPMGAIKAGNKEGTIPEWTGGVCKPPAGYQPKFGDAGGGPYVDPFAADKPLFKITAANMAQYADKLDEGSKELFRLFPQTFYMNVYPTRRSACFPDWVYDNTIKRAMNPKIVGNIPSITGAHAQYPFPIPKSGVEALWNIFLAYSAPNIRSAYKVLYMDVAGNRSLIDVQKQTTWRPYWDNSVAMLPEGSTYQKNVSATVYPPAAAGTLFLQHRQMRPDLKGDPNWSYSPGQRRVRMSPEFAYDNVPPTAGGTFLSDESSGFAGRMDKFDFKLLGRKEMYIPYNNNEQRMNYDEKVVKPSHMDPEAPRYELHRVWVVEGTLKPNERHVQKKKVIYLDEDSWVTATYQGYDHAGKVHHSYVAYLAQMYDRPGVAPHSYNFYDHIKGAYTFWINSGPIGTGVTYGVYKSPAVPANTFTPEGLMGAGVR